VALVCDEYDDSCGPRLDFVLDMWTLFIYLFILCPFTLLFFY